MPAKILFTSYELGNLKLPNRVVMAPMTRCRVSGPSYAPTTMTAEYYAQRASAGLIISEGIMVSDQARGYCDTPGLYTAEQERCWKQVTDAVHRRGGRIFAQLWHCGRVSHTLVHADFGPPVGPSNIAAESEVFVHDPQTGKVSKQHCSQPRALSTEEARQVTSDFVQAATRAILAGFDGVEIHGANGYLFDQFRCPYLNNRTDQYGGSLENRCRLLIETADAVAKAIGGSRTGVRLSPLGIANDMHFDPEPESTYGYLAGELDRLGVAYLHLNQQDGRWIHNAQSSLLRAIRDAFTRTVILCGGFYQTVAEAALRSGAGDLIAFGRPYVSNPDLVDRFRHALPLTPCDPSVFYAGGAEGYIDFAPYPPVAAASAGIGKHRVAGSTTAS